MSQSTETTVEVSHDHSIYAENIFSIGNFSVTNSLLNSWLAVFYNCDRWIGLKTKIKMVPRGLQNAMEAIIEFMSDLFIPSPALGKRPKGFFRLFTFFILS